MTNLLDQNPFREGTQKYKMFNGLVLKPCTEYHFKYISQFHARLLEMKPILFKLGLCIKDDFKKTKTGNKFYRIIKKEN